jgi:serine/threonine-protein kinase RsbW
VAFFPCGPSFAFPAWAGEGRYQKPSATPEGGRPWHECCRWPAARSARAPRLAAPGPGSDHATLCLEPDPACVATVRHLARRLLDRLGWDPDRADDAVLLVSEIVTNAVAQAAPGCGERPAIIVTLRGNPAELSILAWDNGSCDGLPEQPGPAADDAESGRGLGITASLTGGRWGWWETPYCGGKVISPAAGLLAKRGLTGV